MIITITEKCSANCDICFLNCSPKNNLRLSLEEIFFYIEQASKIKNIDSIVISGGEPFLYYNDFLKIVRKSKKLNLKIGCSTNGYWAKSEPETNSILEELISAGLTSLRLSVDEFHSKFIPLPRIKNIIKAINKLFIKTGKLFPVYIHSISTKSNNGMNYVVENFKDDMRYFSSENFMTFKQILQARAKKNITEDDFLFLDYLPDSKCVMMNCLTIYCDGKVYSCCSVSGLTNSLCIGNVKTESLSKIINNLKYHPICNIIKIKGFNWIVECLKTNNSSIDLNKKFVSICHLCSYIFKNEDNVKLLMRYIKNALIDEYEKYLTNKNKLNFLCGGLN